jgi:precorrin-2 dehydrogenase/sirohydrochlorin ferrochelatase
MDAFPAFFPLAGRTVVVAGAGELAEAKARLFGGSPATLVRLSDAAALKPENYAGALLAFIAGGETAFLSAARAAAKASGALVNVADHPELCDFITPAVIDRGAVVAAVGTGGAAPLLAALLRNDIEVRVPEGVGRIAALLQEMQAEVRAALPDAATRRAFLRAVLDGPAATAAMAGDSERARALLQAALAGSRQGPPQGRVCIILPPEAPDLLSLRAARRLAEADVLVASPSADAGLVVLARRDARRLNPDEADLATLASAGLLVVILGPLPDDQADALSAADVSVEILSSATSPA